MAKKEIKKLTLKNFDFDEFYDSLQAFYFANEHVMVPYDYIDYRYDEGYPLGRAVTMLRSHKLVDDVQHIKLNKLGFVWNPKFLFEYKDFYARVKNYLDTHKVKVIKENVKNEDGYPLGKKLKTVQNGYKIFIGEADENLPHIMLKAYQYKELEKLGIQLDKPKKTFSREFYRDPSMPTFVYEQYLDHLKSYIAEQRKQNGNGGVFVKKAVVCDDGYPLGRFSEQIRNYKRGYDRQQIVINGLEVKQYDEIQKCGFLFKKFGTFDFDEYVQQLQQFHQENNTYEVPEKYMQGDYPLGSITANIKKTNNHISQAPINKYILSDEQQQTLSDMGFVWVRAPGTRFDFDDYYNRLMQYKNEHNGDVCPKKDYVCKDGYKLGTRTYHIRVGRRRHIEGRDASYILTDEQYDKLDRAGFKWNVGTKFSLTLIENKYLTSDEQVPTLTKKRKTSK